MRFEGADAMRVAGGDLVLKVGEREVRWRKPVAYQTIGGRRTAVACRYQVNGRRVAFAVARYDRTRALVVDPVVSYSTFIGGTGTERGYAIAVDPAGYAYSAGQTVAVNFPATPGAYQSSNRGLWDCYITKLTPAGDAVVYSTYLGGTGNYDSVTDIAADAAGSAYVTGWTSSTDFPTTPGAMYGTYSGTWGAYLTKLSPTGTSLVYSTYLGSTSNSTGYGIAVDGQGAAYVAGSHGPDFPTTPGAYSTTVGTGFVTKVAPSGDSLVYSTYLGGAGTGIYDVCIDATGAAYVAGDTEVGMPTTPGAYDETHNGGRIDAFAAKLDPSGSALLWATYLGGAGDDTARSICVGSTGEVTVAGDTGSADFPVTAGSAQQTYGGNGDAFVTRLNAAGSALVWSTFLGGTSSDRANGVATDAAGAAYAAGFTYSRDYPITADAFDSFNDNWYDVLFTALDASTGGLVFSTYIGGNDIDNGYAIAAGTGGAVYIGGNSYSVDFPVTPGAYDTTTNSGTDADAFVMKIVFPVVTVATTLTVSPASGDFGETVDLTATLVRGSDSAPLAGKSVAFKVEGTDAGSGMTDASGVATVAYLIPESLGEGARTISGDFAGDETHDPSSDSDTLTVSRYGTTLTVGDRSGIVGQSASLGATLTRTVGGALSGMAVAFTVEGTAAGSGTTDGSGVATSAYTIVEGSGAGGRAIGASFAGDALNAPSTGDGTLTVSKADTTLWAANRTGTISEVVALRQYDLKRTTDNQMLSAKSITYKIDGTAVGTASTDAGGDSVRNWVISEGPATRTITAEFAGDAAYSPSSDDAMLTCQSWTTKMATFNRTARITDRTELRCRLLRSDNVPLYGKSINFYVDGTFVITRPTDVQGYAKHPNYTVPDGAGAGVRTILSEWPGNGGYAPISKTATLTVNRAVAYIWVLRKTIPQGSIANLYAYFRRLYDYQKQAGKTVDFKIDGTVVQTVITDNGGVARYLYPTTEAPGVYTIRCEFYGDAWLDPGYGEAPLTIY